MWLYVIHATGFSLGGLKDVYTGDVFYESDVKNRVLPWLSKSWVREATEDEIAAAKKAAKTAAQKAVDDDGSAGDAKAGKK